MRRPEWTNIPEGSGRQDKLEKYYDVIGNVIYGRDEKKETQRGKASENDQ